VLTNPDGRRARRSFLGRTRATVRDRLRDALAKEANGIATPNERLTVGTFLETWLVDVVRPSCRPSTISSYTGIVRRHLLPGLGAHSLARLSSQHVQHFLNSKTPLHIRIIPSNQPPKRVDRRPRGPG
jgi:integrase